jgi:hypothetical protein
MIRWAPSWVITVLSVSGCPSGSTTTPEPTAADTPAATDTPAAAATPATTDTPASANTPSPAVARRLGALQRCYEDALRRRPDVAGRMTYTIRISDLGTITDVSIELDELGDPTFTECTRTKIAAWRFATPSEDGEVTFSVVYSPKKAPPPPP